jgi:TetR/AcrR family transcriptional regulator
MPTAKSKANHKRAARTPEETKAAILRAAMQEFADSGLDGARTDAIARKAGVNKALIHYYYKNKQSLYGASLDLVFAGLAKRMHEVLDRALPPREAVLAFAGAHFDYLASSPMYPRLVQHEMMRAGSPSPHIRRIVKRYLRPVQQRLVQILMQGVQSAELRPINPFHFVFSMVAMNVFYFAGAPVVALITGKDPLDPARVAERRASVLDVVSAAVTPSQSQKSSSQRKANT